MASFVRCALVLAAVVPTVPALAHAAPVAKDPAAVTAAPAATPTTGATSRPRTRPAHDSATPSKRHREGDTTRRGHGAHHGAAPAAATVAPATGATVAPGSKASTAKVTPRAHRRHLAEGHTTEPTRRELARLDGAQTLPPLALLKEEPSSTSTEGARAKGPCLRDPVTFVRGSEETRFSLSKCDGAVAPLALEQLSIVARPDNAARPTSSLPLLAKTTGTRIAPGVRRLDTRLVERLQALVDHFAHEGKVPRVHLVAGAKAGAKASDRAGDKAEKIEKTPSLHSMGRALDVKLEGVKGEDVSAFCKTLPDTGCGFYPKSGFVHVDVRDKGTGHVAWIDASAPGEAPKYVAAWPVLKEPVKGEKADENEETAPSSLKPDLPAVLAAPADDDDKR